MAEVGQEIALGPAGRLRAAQRQAQRLGLLLHLGDVDAKPDDTAVGGRPLLDHHPAAVGDALLVPHARVQQQRHALCDPLVLATYGVGIVASRHADPQRVLELAARGEQVGRAVVDLRVAPVPEDVATLAVEEDDPFGDAVDGLAQPLFGPPRVAFGALEGVLVPAAQERGQGRQAAVEPPRRLRQTRLGPTHATIPAHPRQTLRRLVNPRLDASHARRASGHFRPPPPSRRAPAPGRWAPVRASLLVRSSGEGRDPGLCRVHLRKACHGPRPSRASPSVRSAGSVV